MRPGNEARGSTETGQCTCLRLAAKLLLLSDVRQPCLLHAVRQRLETKLGTARGQRLDDSGRGGGAVDGAALVWLHLVKFNFSKKSKENENLVLVLVSQLKRKKDY